MGAEPLRTARAGELGEARVGEEVRLAGWVARRRDHGGVIFLDLRDASGVVQTVVDPEEAPEVAEAAGGVRPEHCVALGGRVRLRPEGTENPELATGAVEVEVTDLRVLSPAETPPFPIDDRAEVDELVRLEYRYLDLRRPRMARNLRARSAAVGRMRRVMEERGFLEVETPTLIRSTPEGARDLLVPSRLRRGHFYALPQSPQLFKQLLMLAGVERYYQIARCYRDEDFRADRQVEFTQLDLEGSFWGREEVLETLEVVTTAVVEELRGTAPAAPFPRLSYRDALERYGTDKPDVRFGMEIRSLSEAFSGTGFRAFGAVLEKGGVVRGLNGGPQDLSRSELDALVEAAQEAGAKGLVWAVVEGDGSLRSPVAKFLSDGEQKELVRVLEGEEGDLLLAVADREEVAARVLGRLRMRLGRPEGHGELRFLWVVDFPVFERTPEGTLVPSHHPFTAPSDLEELRGRPEEAVAQAYDLVVNGVELGSGSVRIHDPDVQREVFEVLGIGSEQAERRFGWFLRALRYGTPPHAGFALGIDRLLSVLLEEPSIREVIPFPKTQTGLDPLTRAPTVVEEGQLAELGIELRPEVRRELEEDGSERGG